LQKQENLANTKVSARQPPCHSERHSTKLLSSAKFQENLNL